MSGGLCSTKLIKNPEGQTAGYCAPKWARSVTILGLCQLSILFTRSSVHTPGVSPLGLPHNVESSLGLGGLLLRRDQGYSKAAAYQPGRGARPSGPEESLDGSSYMAESGKSIGKISLPMSCETARMGYPPGEIPLLLSCSAHIKTCFSTHTCD
jgi:hypothetical protein